jgi:hypothetical protein
MATGWFKQNSSFRGVLYVGTFDAFLVYTRSNISDLKELSMKQLGKI